ncbi:MAG: hypothetical protein WBR15_02920 [Gammaproteobacteria bacterium]
MKGAYGKHFECTYTGSLYGKGAEVFAVWGYVISHLRFGYVELNPLRIASEIGMSPESVQKVIDFLCEPDPRSRTKTEDGRRLIRQGEFEYRSPTYEIYNAAHGGDEVRDFERERKRAYREKLAQQGSVPDSPGQTGNVPDVPDKHGITGKSHTPTPTPTPEKNKNTVRRAGRFVDFWMAYPKKVKRRPTEALWAKKKLDPLADELIADIRTRLKEDDRWIRGFIPDPNTYLSQERWRDEISQPGMSA